MLGLVGTKKGMTRVFKDDGASVPVTVIEVCKSKIVQRKTEDKDARDQYETRTHKRLFDIVNPTEQTVDALMRLDIAAGVDVKITLN